MKHHYIVYAWMRFDAVCKMGAICSEEELPAILGRRNVKGYKMISVDDIPKSGWSDREWTLL